MKLIACLSLSATLLAGTAASQRLDVPFRTASTVDQKQCLHLYNAFVASLVVELGGLPPPPVSAEEYSASIGAPTFVDRYRWRIARGLSSNAEFRVGGTRSLRYTSIAIAQPAGYVTEIEGAPVFCNSAAVGIQQATVAWRNTYPCDEPKEGRRTFAAPGVIALLPDRLRVQGIDYRSTETYDLWVF